jgi:hypothetical protein
VTLDSTECWNKQKTLAKAKGYQAVVAVDKCISVTADIKVQNDMSLRYQAVVTVDKCISVTADIKVQNDMSIRYYVRN